jgi:hypothetical protein
VALVPARSSACSTVSNGLICAFGRESLDSLAKASIESIRGTLQSHGAGDISLRYALQKVIILGMLTADVNAQKSRGNPTGSLSCRDTCFSEKGFLSRILPSKGYALLWRGGGLPPSMGAFCCDQLACLGWGRLYPCMSLGGACRC